MCLEAEQRTAATRQHISRDWVRVLLPRSGCEGELHMPRERLLYPGWISLLQLFFFFPHHSTFKHLQRDKCVCDPTNAHVHAVTNSATRSLSTSPWCVAYTVQRAHTSHPHWHEHTDMFPSLDLWGSYGDKLSYRTRVWTQTLHQSNLTEAKTQRNTCMSHYSNKKNQR